MSYDPPSAAALTTVPLPPGGSRASGTIYQNTTGRPVFLSVIATVSVGTAYLECYCDASSPPTTAVVSKRGDASTTVTIFAVIPGGSYYKVDTSGGSTSSVTQWTEHLLPGAATQGQPVRALATQYQNSSAGPRIVVVSLAITDYFPDIRIGSSNPAATVVMQSGSAARDLLFAVVPASWWYTVPALGGNSIVAWTEYDWTGVSATASPDLSGRGAPTSSVRYLNGAQSGCFAVVCTRDGNRTLYASQSDVVGGYNTGDARVFGSITSLCTASGGATGLEYGILYVPPGAGYTWYATTAPDSIPVWREYTVQG